MNRVFINSEIISAVQTYLGVNGGIVATKGRF